MNKAAEMIKKATECESEERFDESVGCYRKAIGTLLTSLSKDKCLHRQASVKRRIAQYIGKAEILTKLASSSGTVTKVKIRILILYIFCLHYFEFPALLTSHFSREKAREIQNNVNKK